MRPDLAVLRPFQIQFSPTYGRFRLSVGDMTHSEFGDGDVIINSFTWECGNDWLAIGTASQMYRSMSILPHLVQNTFYLPCNALHNSANAVEKELSQTGTEHFHDRFWFATTTKVVRMPLGIELARTSCMQMGCLRQSPFTRLDFCARENWCYFWYGGIHAGLCIMFCWPSRENMSRKALLSKQDLLLYRSRVRIQHVCGPGEVSLVQYGIARCQSP